MLSTYITTPKSSKMQCTNSLISNMLYPHQLYNHTGITKYRNGKTKNKKISIMLELVSTIRVLVNKEIKG